MSRVIVALGTSSVSAAFVNVPASTTRTKALRLTSRRSLHRIRLRLLSPALEVEDRAGPAGLQRVHGGLQAALDVVGLEERHRDVEHGIVSGRHTGDGPGPQQRLVSAVGPGGSLRDPL